VFIKNPGTVRRNRRRETVRRNRAEKQEERNSAEKQAKIPALKNV
jgi:hypothetical protein